MRHVWVTCAFRLRNDPGMLHTITLARAEKHFAYHLQSAIAPTRIVCASRADLLRARAAARAASDQIAGDAALTVPRVPRSRSEEWGDERVERAETPSSRSLQEPRDAYDASHRNGILTLRR